jgi:hypothetical protein
VGGKLRLRHVSTPFQGCRSSQLNDFDSAHFAPTAALGTLAFATGSYLSPAGSLRRTLLASAFGAYVVIIPFTLLFSELSSKFPGLLGLKHGDL